MERAVVELVKVIQSAMADARLAEQIFADPTLREQLRREPRLALGAFAVTAAHVTIEQPERVVLTTPLGVRSAA